MMYKRLFVCLLLLVVNSTVFAQIELKKIYDAKDDVEFERYLKKIGSGIYGNPQSEFGADLNAIMAKFMDFHVKSEYAKRKVQIKDRYFIIQSDLLCAKVDDINVDSIQKVEMWMKQDYELLTLVPGGFGFYNFKNIYTQENVANPVDALATYPNNLKALKLPKVYISQLNQFLRGDSYLSRRRDTSYGNRVAFLQTKLVATNPGRRPLLVNKEYIVDYDFNINRAVFNLKMEKAILQCAYPNGSAEFYFEKQNGEWNLVKKWDLLIVD
ncbi:hypothetical protein VRU48_09095 [Pedobacter sp. KR3-3]|uniref:Uncharacterized protein n=1 Tax=Pedobacter albus TaxID=3113905 RepID=A0ABU7I731_9SPHI|nr:hypothetical protein [Pedobacter sp. KR3-3]MEE1945263.1 hypothetical protein [Pedobacter sp. KR3-3]